MRAAGAPRDLGSRPGESHVRVQPGPAAPVPGPARGGAGRAAAGARLAGRAKGRATRPAQRAAGGLISGSAVTRGQRAVGERR